MARLWVAAICLAGLISVPVAAMDLTVTSQPITTFKDVAIGEKVDGLIWRGGIQLESRAPEFGGLSGIAFVGPDQKLAMVADIGQFISGQLIYDDAGRPLELIGVHASAIQNSKGEDLPRPFVRDAEAIYAIKRNGDVTAVRVGFENLTRVADFSLTDNRPGGAAREVRIPAWLTTLRTNRSLEAVCIAPPASPVASSTILITEGQDTPDGNIAATMLGNRDRGDFSLIKTPGLRPTDCAFLPDGDLLVLERGIGLFSFVMQIRRIQAAEVKPGAVLAGEVILTASGGDIDNMEGMAVHTGPGGETRITLISDNNFNDWERSLLLEFSLPPE